MGRELRMVPPDWEHPKNDKGEYAPLLNDLSENLMSWHREKAQWDRGFIAKYPDGWEPRSENEYAQNTDDFEDWNGKCPDPADYMPYWPAEVCTHFQMYESCSEGTPISPICKTAEELARWLADNNASAFGIQTASYESWLATINRGWAISAVATVTGLESGVTGMHKTENLNDPEA